MIAKKETEKRRFFRCEVTLPDGRLKPVTLDARASGHDCLQMVCNSLGVLDESDYFGLTYPGCSGEELWVNSRNRLAKQVPRGSRHQLRLAVRFFVQPHMLVLEDTRHLLLLEARRRIAERRLSPDDDDGEKLATLEQASSLPDYGCHYYPVWDCYRVKRCVGVGPQAVYICREDRSILERYAFPRVQKVTNSGRLVYLSLSNPDGCTKEVGFRLSTAKAATGLYRCVTETHSFFRCDSVRTGVSEQKCRDFKAALASLIFPETDAAIDPKFVFDVRKTAREVHDCARRRLFRHCLMAAAGGVGDVCAETAPSDMERAHAASATAEATAAALRERLEALLQERTCRLCADQPVSVVFVPCGHMVACETCSEKLPECPLCRQPVSIRQRCHIPC